MPESYESMMVRLGFDASEVKAGTDAMLGVQKRAALEYSTLWQTAAEKKLAAEQVAAVKSFQLFEADLKKRVEAKLAADALIAAGSVPENMAGGAARGATRALEAEGMTIAGGYAFSKAGKVLGKIGEDGKLVKGAEELAAGAGKAAHEMHGMGGIVREISVVIHEGISGRFKQMLGSLIRLAALIGGSSLLVGTGLVAAGLAAIVGPSAYRTYKAIQGEKESDKSLHTRVDNEAEELRHRVEGLKRLGVLTDVQEAELLRKLKDPTADSINSVFGATNKYLASGSVDSQIAKQEAKKKESAEVARIQAEAAREESEAGKEGETHEQKKGAAEKERWELQKKMFFLRIGSVEYAQAELDLARLNRDVNHETAEIAKEKAEHDQKALDLNKEYHEDLKKQRDLQDKINDIDIDRPTIGQLAGRRFNAALEREYGQGGRYDLERGNGPFGHIAREAELAQKREMWDIVHGNAQFDAKGNLIGGDALEDRNRRIFFENQLSGAGLETPAMKQAKMAEDMKLMTERIGVLVAAATKDGIKLKDE